MFENLLSVLCNGPFPQSLYKYKKSTDYNIDTLVNNRLYVPRCDKLNDEKEIGFSTNSQNKECIEALNHFHELSKKGCYILSFGTKNDNCYLWEEYAENYTGFVIEYDFEQLLKRIKKTRNGARYNYVKYTDDKYLLPDSFLKEYHKKMYTNCIVESGNPYFLFLKDRVWCHEEEFRFAFGIEDCDVDYINDYGAIIYNDHFYIENIYPKSVTVGYNISQTNLSIIKKYCTDNNVDFRIAPINSKNIN